MPLLAKIEPLLDGIAGAGDMPELTGSIRELIRKADVEFLTGEIPTAIEQSLEGLGRVAEIVRAMKEFSHPSETMVATDLNRAISSTVTVARNEWKYVADLEARLAPDLPMVPCLPGEFNQVILNMIVNAAHAIAAVVGDGSNGKGRITIETECADDRAVIRNSDTGCWHPQGDPEPRPRPVLHDQGGRQGDGPGARHRPQRRRQEARRGHRAAQRGRGRHDVHGAAAARAGRRAGAGGGCRMKKNLFVDDEPRILDGLKRMLRGMREQWDMHFAEGSARQSRMSRKRRSRGSI
jgi:hypothetical protein